MTAQRPELDYPDGLFEIRGSLIHPTTLTRSPWNHDCLHGGAVSGIAGWGVETTLGRTDLQCVRLTVDIMRMVPVRPLRVVGEVVKASSRSAVVDVAVECDETAVARASAQFLAQEGDDLGPQVNVLPDIVGRPGDTDEFDYPRPGFNADAVEQRIDFGSSETPGPGRIWCRLFRPLIADRDTTPFQLAATLSDLGAGVGWEHAASGRAMINADVTMHLLRPPVGEWVCLDAETHFSGVGTAVCRTSLHDLHGPVGWVLQSQIEAPPHLDVT